MTEPTDSDKKIITLIDLSVNRQELTSGVCFALNKLRLYSENYQLLEEIDVSESLKEELEGMLDSGESRLALRA